MVGELETLEKLLAFAIIAAAFYFGLTSEEKPFSNPKGSILPRAQQLATILNYLKDNPHMWENTPDQAREWLAEVGFWDEENNSITEKGTKWLAEVRELKKNPKMLAHSQDVFRNMRFLRKHPEQFETVPDDVMETLILMEYYDPDKNEVTVKGLNFLNEYNKLNSRLEAEA